MEPITVRFATGADLAMVTGDGQLPEAVVRRKIEWREVLVAEQGGETVGYLRLDYIWSLVPYIALVRVAPDARRQGVGRALLRYLEGYLREAGHGALYSSSQVDEPEPQAWHRHMGFAECGLLAGINEGGVGELFFRKPLA